MNPHSLNAEEWKEIASIPTVRESWGIVDDSDIESFKMQVYAAKFHFVSGSPGYVGDLFILQGDVLTGDAPLVLQRGPEGKLFVL